jgi:hypothetical protein
MIRIINSETSYPGIGNRQRRWDIVTFLLAGNDFFPFLLFSWKAGFKSATTASFENTICDMCTS